MHLYTSRETLAGAPAAVYEVECAQFKALTFELDITLSQNFKIEGCAEKKIQVSVGPYQRVRVARLIPSDSSRRAVLKVKYRWALGEAVVSIEHLQQDVALRDAVVEKMLGRVAALRLDSGHHGHSAEQIQKRCLESSVMFIDSAFPPLSTSLRWGPSRDRLLTWRRPSEFMDGPCAVFDCGIEPADIRQGSLADCWLQCALAGLAEFPELVENLFSSSPDISGAGVYSVRLCRNGYWREYVLDDYFPCFADGGGPIFSRNHGNELWVMLVEKAFAKSFGGFEAMRFGWSYEAMIDLTGCPFRTIRLQDEDVVEDIAAGLVWSVLAGFDAAGYLISASTPGEDMYSEDRTEFAGTAGRSSGPNGLVSGHAYTILTVTETQDGQYRLLKLRNPWGRFEWQGAWSDSSPLWTASLREELGAQAVVDDGTFWMCFDDVCKYFYSINVSMVARWEEQRRRTHLVFPPAGQLPGRHMVPPMYVLTVPGTSKVFLSLHQEDSREAEAPPYIDIAISVLRILPDYSFDLVVASGPCVERQVQVEATLPEGHYIVVCCSSGCKYAQYAVEAGSKYFDIGTAGSHSGGEDSGPACLLDGGCGLTDVAKRAFREVFSRLDEDMDGVLNYAELDRYLQLTENCALDVQIFNWMLKQFDSRDGGLSEQGFLQAQLYMCVESGCDEATLLNDLMFMGYSKQLQLIRSKSVVLAVHSDLVVSLRTQPFDKVAYAEALELPVRQWGVCKEYENGAVKLYTYKCGYTGVCIAVENCSVFQPLSMEIDASHSINVVSSRGSLVSADVVPCGAMRVLHYLMMRDIGDWSWTFEASYKWLVVA